MKVSKYRVSGMIHNKGTDAMSVLMKVVNPSNRLDGTNARGQPMQLGGQAEFVALVGCCYLRRTPSLAGLSRP